jgi:uncharacterized protein YecE (DUF72 family)
MYRHWRGVFYPPDLPVKDWFRYYAQHFNTVEINSTFYRLPAPETFLDWLLQAPRGFLYAVKASRFLTHRKKLKDPEEALQTMLQRYRLLGPSLGPILYQLPPRWRCDLERLRHFLALLPRDLSHVFEFRDPSWCNEAVRALLEETGMSFCIHDMRDFLCPLWVTGPVIYLRFHGPTARKYAGRYPIDDLQVWAERIHFLQGAGRPVYMYFNNDDRGYALVNAREMRNLLLAPASALPPRS